jgi:hypothetical protein
MSEYIYSYKLLNPDLPTVSTLSDNHIRVYNRSTILVVDKITFIKASSEGLYIFTDGVKMVIEFHSKVERDAEFHFLLGALKQRHANVDNFFRKGQGYKELSDKLNPDVADKIMEYL